MVSFVESPGDDLNKSISYAFNFVESHVDDLNKSISCKYKIR